MTKQQIINLLKPGKLITTQDKILLLKMIRTTRSLVELGLNRASIISLFIENKQYQHYWVYFSHPGYLSLKVKRNIISSMCDITLDNKRTIISIN